MVKREKFKNVIDPSRDGTMMNAVIMKLIYDSYHLIYLKFKSIYRLIELLHKLA